MNGLFRYGMLAVILGLLAFDIRWRSQLSATYPYDRYSTMVVVLMLLFNHLAFQFHWSPRIAAALRVLAWAGLAFGSFYIFYLSSRLYPL